MLNNLDLDPGSEEARKKGCTCPIMDNPCGDGRFYVKLSCPLHGTDEEIKK